MLEVFGNPQHPTTRNFVRTVLHNRVPDSVKETLQEAEGRQLFKLEFIGHAASQPILNGLIRQYPVDVNILSANMSEIQGTTLGSMIIQLNGESSAIDKAISYLEECGVTVKEASEEL